ELADLRKINAGGRLERKIDSEPVADPSIVANAIAPGPQVGPWKAGEPRGVRTPGQTEQDHILRLLVAIDERDQQAVRRVERLDERAAFFGQRFPERGRRRAVAGLDFLLQLGELRAPRELLGGGRKRWRSSLRAGQHRPADQGDGEPFHWHILSERRCTWC